MPSLEIRCRNDFGVEACVERIDGDTVEVELSVNGGVVSEFRTKGAFTVSDCGGFLRLDYGGGYVLCRAIWAEYGEDFSCETSGDKTIYTPISDEELEALLADKEAVQ